MSKNGAIVLQSLELLMKEVMLEPYLFRLKASYNASLGPNSKWLIPERVLDDIHMLYVVSGEGTYVVEDVPIELVPNRLLFLMNGVKHQAYRRKKTTLRFFPMRFRLYHPAADTFVPSRVEPFHFYFSPRNGVSIQQLFESVYTYSQLESSVTKDLFVHAALCRALAAIYADYKGSRSGSPVHPGIMKVKKYIDDHPAERTILKELADLAGLSPSYCSKLFHQSVGMPVKEYQMRKTMEYAEYLLKHSTYKVKEMSAIVGYPDPYSFSKQFKRFRGYSPSSVTVET
ncbi:helix-turn-helix domain-containing protein [Paenibacillus ginsengarvi]|uniref:AraC family transcriptional regulator n=1 Tax=Paenibacillus ginsengarvi TaxID=400777 RepID=A0A3B0CGD2_9BACL|nr:AraC family transcriptional regulator [Paenibacillus ginsengarvi]RKN84412.1 AraC family transcriptional regulator [Paenibacillus ginsengarvi]